MSKRQADQSELRDQYKAATFGNGASRHGTEEKNEMGEFEDAWEDEMEEEEIVETVEADEDEDGTKATEP
jgi:ribosome assembly protein RRB1